MNLSNLDLAGIAALVLAILTLYNTLRNRKSDTVKKKVDIVKELTDLAESATSRNIELTRKLNDLECEFIELKGDLQLFTNLQEEWLDGITLLIAQIRKRGQEPVWEPDLTDLIKLKETYKKQ